MNRGLRAESAPGADGLAGRCISGETVHRGPGCPPLSPCTHSSAGAPQSLQLPTKREGIFVMPLERITILSTYT